MSWIIGLIDSELEETNTITTLTSDQSAAIHQHQTNRKLLKTTLYMQHHCQHEQELKS